MSDASSTGNTIHEIDHAIGFHHEQCRADRDNFITINWNNIQPGFEGQFLSYTQSGLDEIAIEGGLDLGSVMMYG